uniref:ENC1 protein n=1 Tax=Giardia intestinalis TaxID=5741 RepID=P92129_GIAIN|nr:ENC1 [Giardia intestinalis]
MNVGDKIIVACQIIKAIWVPEKSNDKICYRVGKRASMAQWAKQRIPLTIPYERRLWEKALDTVLNLLSNIVAMSVSNLENFCRRVNESSFSNVLMRDE